MLSAKHVLIALLLPISLFAVAPQTPDLANKTKPAKTNKPSKPKAGPEVLVVSDVLTEDKDCVLASADKPIFYVFLGGKVRHIGTPYKGEPMPKMEAISQELVKVLKKSHYHRTKVGGPAPSIALLCSWGSASPDITDFDETTSDTTTGQTSTTTTTHMSNARQMRLLAGAHKAQDKLLFSTEIEQINDAIRSDRLYIFIAAFDAQALAKKEKKLLWRTSMTIDSRRNSLADSFRTMIATAGPYFGHENEINEYIDEKMRQRNATVQFGELLLIDEDVTQGKSPSRPAPAPATPAKPRPAPVSPNKK